MILRQMREIMEKNRFDRIIKSSIFIPIDNIYTIKNMITLKTISINNRSSYNN